MKEEEREGEEREKEGERRRNKSEGRRNARVLSVSSVIATYILLFSSFLYITIQAVEG